MLRACGLNELPNGSTIDGLYRREIGADAYHNLCLRRLRGYVLAPSDAGKQSTNPLFRWQWITGINTLPSQNTSDGIQMDSTADIITVPVGEPFRRDLGYRALTTI